MGIDEKISLQQVAGFDHRWLHMGQCLHVMSLFEGIACSPGVKPQDVSSWISRQRDYERHFLSRGVAFEEPFSYFMRGQGR